MGEGIKGMGRKERKISAVGEGGKSKDERVGRVINGRMFPSQTQT